MKRIDNHTRLVLALLLPFLAWCLQSLLWEFVTPFATFFFYPAVFLSSWLGGRRGGLLATLVSLGLIGYFFVEPIHSFNVLDPNHVRLLLMFLLMGVTFALTLGRIQLAADRQRAADIRFRTLFEEAPLGVAVIDSLNGHIYEINPRFAEIVGRTREAMTRVDWMAITHPDDVQADLDQMARLNGGEISGFQMDKRYLKPDGAVVWVQMTIAPVSVAPGEARRHFCLIEDIGERRAAAQRQALADERLRLANDVADIGVWDWDLHNNRLEWDERMCLSLVRRYAGGTANGLFLRALAELGAPRRSGRRGSQSATGHRHNRPLGRHLPDCSPGWRTAHDPCRRHRRAQAGCR
jgi:PAS domain S-box-containing protein